MTKHVPTVVYEDKDIIAVNKPAGLAMHADGAREMYTLADWIKEHYPRLKDVGEPIVVGNGEKISRFGIVHRLDKETSGVLLLAKHQDAFFFFKASFQSRKVKKTYRAFTYGEIGSHEGVIDTPIGRSAADFRKRATEKTRGVRRSALTRYRVIEKNRSFSYVDVSPHTGRTHQIRVHLKSIGHPVVCDALYAPKKPCPPELGRLALHSFSLACTTPSGASLCLEAPLPFDMEAFGRQQFPHTLHTKA